MSRLIYIIPWAICDTENLYIKRLEQTGVSLPKERDIVDDWTVDQVIPNPDRRSKDVFVVLDVYCGYDFTKHNQEVSIVDLSNSVTHLRELGYMPADDAEREFLRQKVLKWDQPVRHAKKAGTKVRKR